MAKKNDYKQQLEEYRQRGKLILALHKSGRSFVEIGKKFGISRQRARMLYLKFKAKSH